MECGHFQKKFELQMVSLFIIYCIPNTSVLQFHEEMVSIFENSIEINNYNNNNYNNNNRTTTTTTMTTTTAKTQLQQHSYNNNKNYNKINHYNNSNTTTTTTTTSTTQLQLQLQQKLLQQQQLQQQQLQQQQIHISGHTLDLILDETNESLVKCVEKGHSFADHSLVQVTICMEKCDPLEKSVTYRKLKNINQTDFSTDLNDSWLILLIAQKNAILMMIWRPK